MTRAQRLEQRNLILAQTRGPKLGRVNWSRPAEFGVKTPGFSEPNRLGLSEGPNSAAGNDVVKGSWTYSISRLPQPTKPRSETRPAPPTTSSAASATTKAEPPYQRLSDAEMRRRRDLGLCFRCEEKFGPNHRCRNRQLRLLILEPDEDDHGGEAALQSATILGTEHPPEMELSINSTVGFTTGNTMKLLGQINGHDVMVLIDSGATHNFINSKLVTKLGLQIEGTKKLGSCRQRV